MFGTLRAFAFQAAFYVWTLLACVFGLPFMLVSRNRAWLFGRTWGRVSLWLLRRITGTRLEMRGLEHVPQGPCIVAAKHQSAMETLALFLPFSDPTYILKHELTRIPLFGWWMRKFRQIPVRRGKGGKRLEQMVDHSRRAVAEGRQILIFPEGTRRRPGEAPQYKYGVTRLYDELGVPCVPVAINAGVFWPRRQIALFPGVAVMQFLPPIPPGLPKAEFAERLESTIEDASNSLLLEAADDGVPLSATAQARVDELRRHSSVTQI